MESCASYIRSLLGHGSRGWLWNWMGSWLGPDMIGYVGAGCGVGFSIGITLAGVDIGLPANRLLKVPFSAFMATRRSVMDIARSSGVLGARTGVNASMQRWVSIFNRGKSASKRVDMKRLMSSNAKLVLDWFKNHHRG